MLRLPLPAVFAALVLVAAGSVVVNLYFKADKAYVLDLSDLRLNETKTVALDYIPARIMIASNKSGAVYEICMHIDGMFAVPIFEAPQYYEIYHDIYCDLHMNGTILPIRPIDVKSTRVEITARYVYDWS